MTQTEPCPNCEKPTACIVSTGLIVGRFLGVRHCGCYYQQPSPGVEHTCEGDHDLWSAMPQELLDLQALGEQLRHRLIEAAVAGNVDLGLWRRFDRTHAEFHQGCVAWCEQWGGDIPLTTCWCGQVFGT